MSVAENRPNCPGALSRVLDFSRACWKEHNGSSIQKVESAAFATMSTEAGLKTRTYSPRCWKLLTRNLFPCSCITSTLFRFWLRSRSKYAFAVSDLHYASSDRSCGKRDFHRTHDSSSRIFIAGSTLLETLVSKPLW